MLKLSFFSFQWGSAKWKSWCAHDSRVESHPVGSLHQKCLVQRNKWIQILLCFPPFFVWYYYPLIFGYKSPELLLESEINREVSEKYPTPTFVPKTWAQALVNPCPQVIFSFQIEASINPSLRHWNPSSFLCVLCDAHGSNIILLSMLSHTEEAIVAFDVKLVVLPDAPIRFLQEVFVLSED